MFALPCPPPRKVDVKRSGLFGHSSGASAALTAAAFSRNVSLAPFLVPFSGPVGRVSPSLVSAPAPGQERADPSWPDVRAVFALSVAVVAIPAAAPPAVRAPVFLLLGRRDGIVSPEQQEGIFSGLTGSPRRVLAVMGCGNHCFLDPMSFYPYPPSDCDLSLSRQREILSPSAQSFVARRSVVAWFRAALYGEGGAAEALAWGQRLKDDLLMDVRAPAAAPCPAALDSFCEAAGGSLAVLSGRRRRRRQ